MTRRNFFKFCSFFLFFSYIEKNSYKKFIIKNKWLVKKEDLL